ncbi:MAG: IS110 family transposase, partial [Candidatus Sericytochromatia bacterium]|nr:IS110 family transposase [Candidatus Tanganyikabacteria bacterium]
MAALSLKISKTALGAEFRRIARRKDMAVAVFAMARKLAQLVYRMLRYGQAYVDIGEAAYEGRYQARRIAALRSSATELGFTLIPANEAA